jgi:transposase
MKTKTSSKKNQAAVTQTSAIPERTIGIDLGDVRHAVCVLDRDGGILDQRTITNHRESLRRLSKKHPGARVVMEVGSHSPWVSRFMKGLGHEVLVANARKMRAIYTNERKSDELDAMMLARIGRMDPKLLHPIQHGSEQAQRDLLQIKLRDNLVRQRVDIISSVRFTLKSLGVALPSPNTACFAKRARTLLCNQDESLLAMIEPSLQIVDLLTQKIREIEKRIEQLGMERYPVTQRLQQITGVGAITSLAFVLTVGDPQRFTRRRDVGAYLGLVPRRDQSGGLDKQLRISKAGDAYVRRLLVSAAQYILGPFGPDSDLKRHGLQLAERGGRAAKKKAVVAIARKLAALMLALWSEASADYQPLRDAV